jgi:hypothetical protein
VIAISNFQRLLAYRVYLQYRTIGVEALDCYWRAAGIRLDDLDVRTLALELSEVLDSSVQLSEAVELQMLDREAAIIAIVQRYPWMDRQRALETVQEALPVRGTSHGVA